MHSGKIDITCGDNTLTSRSETIPCLEPPTDSASATIGVPPHVAPPASVPTELDKAVFPKRFCIALSFILTALTIVPAAPALMYRASDFWSRPIENGMSTCCLPGAAIKTPTNQTCR
jgi:hypothetical protein